VGALSHQKTRLKERVYKNPIKFLTPDQGLTSLCTASTGARADGKEEPSNEDKGGVPVKIVRKLRGNTVLFGGSNYT